MGRPAKILFLSLSILILSLLMHEYTPHLIMPLMYNPTVKHLTTWVHKMINNPLILLDKEIISDEIIENNSVIQDKKIKLFTVEELNDYNGDVGSKGLCLAILGLVFNVKKGKDHYGPGGGYEFFSGRDGSRAFVSGDFSEEGLIDDISGLSSQDYIGLDEWVKFYKKDYKYVGKLIGRYYDKDGNPTQYNLEAQKWINDAYALKEKDNQEKKIFPPCNSEWFPESGSRVYCTKKSGGIEREWVGVPRKLIKPGHTKPICACVKNFGPPSHDLKLHPHLNRGDLDHPHLKEFTGCKPEDESCKVLEED